LKKDSFKKFLNENPENKILYNYFFTTKNKKVFDILFYRYNAFLFKIHVLKYIKVSINKSAITLKNKTFKEVSRKNKELILNSSNYDYGEDLINSIPDNSSDVLNKIVKNNKTFKQIISNKNLLEAINSLSEKQREILYLIYIKDCKEKEIAVSKKVTIQNINKIKLRALENIRDEWGNCNGNNNEVN
jgi:RNA polymerase sigma factor (sigma-70 family)